MAAGRRRKAARYEGAAPRAPLAPCARRASKRHGVCCATHVRVWPGSCVARFVAAAKPPALRLVAAHVVRVLGGAAGRCRF